ncbi:uncharacterized protein LOC107611049 isoform X1 [Arachis ipaensis]|uniref:uncharacterized protein LOC107611049 isoform X1 n=1 Tax=Arachis ipaensis TaxID=130454 RepID=UPI000A2B6E19|nr:uncharacterized protein LOC107611049 isoform X1 [Arachis ipaensis]
MEANAEEQSSESGGPDWAELTTSASPISSPNLTSRTDGEAPCLSASHGSAPSRALLFTPSSTSTLNSSLPRSFPTDGPLISSVRSIPSFLPWSDGAMDLQPRSAFVTAPIALSLWSPKGANLPLNLDSHFLQLFFVWRVMDNVAQILRCCRSGAALMLLMSLSLELL